MTEQSRPKPIELATHRHKTRRTEYVLLGFGKMQSTYWRDMSRPVEGRDDHHEDVDMREVAIYRSLDSGTVWVRPREEFEDGRFEELARVAPVPERAGDE